MNQLLWKPSFYLYSSFFSSRIGNTANLFFDQVFGIWIYHPRECWQLLFNLCFLACLSLGSVCYIYYCDVSLGRGRGVEHLLKVCSSKNCKYKHKNRTMWVIQKVALWKNNCTVTVSYLIKEKRNKVQIYEIRTERGNNRNRKVEES